MTISPATTSAAAKKDIQKLQRAIVDGLEDVKALDIQVFDTEHITSLFERVIIASGSSNRQTKALAASVRDAVRDAGFAKPRIEGEANGEWIIVDCGAAVAHIMQPVFRQYYHLEELWGEKPIKIKLGAPAPLVKASKAEAMEEPKPAKKRVGAKSAARPAASRKPADAGAKPVAAKKVARTDDGTYVGRVGKSNDWTAKRNATTPAAELALKPARTAVKKAPVKTPVVKVPVAKKAAAKKTAAKKPAPSKPAAKKNTTRSR